MENKLLEAALAYAEIGWHVFPVREKNGSPYKNSKGSMVTPLPKQPYEAGGLLSATKDRDEIVQMWKRHPNAGIGLNCGLSNVFVVDIDNHSGGGAVDTFMKMGISYNGAWQCLTPSFGLHVIYSGTGRTTSNETLQIDTRGKGGYIILPPSYIIVGGKRKHYRKMGDWKDRPMKIPPNCFSKLGIDRSDAGVPRKYNVSETDAETLERAKKLAPRLSVTLAHDYGTWFKIGMSLYSLGEEGFEIWREWTEKYFQEKPDSKRTRDLSKKWNTFSGTKVSIATYIGYASGSYKKWK